ncbi:class I SAM-dependent methyltransferase [Nocardia sp. NBC_00403]|uniref:class I SAM-dependent methyltransferase n=1 Tax=Nocardia sp. NBC_00403 TaxID=2975990 RepID=UPI002E1DFD66
MTDHRDVDATRLATDSLAQGDPTGWFEQLYAAAEVGSAIVPWDADEPNPLLVDWAERHEPAGVGGRALVVGSGLGRDAEHVVRLGFRTTAFDISETAIRTTRERFPNSPVDYVVADLLDPPAEWSGAFDLVVESITVQSMPLSVRTQAIARVAEMVAPGGELLVISGIRVEGEHVDGPPWPLTRAEIESFAVGGLEPMRVEQVSLPTRPEAYRWRAVFRRA